jgi:acyl carrier protein
MTTHSSTTLHVLQEMLGQRLNLPHERITPSTELADIDVDSLMCIDLALFLEAQTGRQIDDDIPRQWKTIQDIINTVDGG